MSGYNTNLAAEFHVLSTSTASARTPCGRWTA